MDDENDNISNSADRSPEKHILRYTLKASAEFAMLPENCLYNIFKYLGPLELDNISKLNQRLKAAADNKRLWQAVDFRPHILTTAKLDKLRKCFKSCTTFLAIRGCVIRLTEREWRGVPVLTSDLLNHIHNNCPVLETLILEEHFGNSSEFNLQLLPKNLLHLSLRGCIITNINPERSYFWCLNAHFPKLKVLILSNCVWIASHDMMSLSKFKNLEELRLDGCPQLGRCIAYTSLATRFGFRSLKIIDLRNTSMCDSDVTCFSWTQNLTHLYLEQKRIGEHRDHHQASTSHGISSAGPSRKRRAHDSDALDEIIISDDVILAKRKCNINSSSTDNMNTKFALSSDTDTTSKNEAKPEDSFSSDDVISCKGTNERAKEIQNSKLTSGFTAVNGSQECIDSTSNSNTYTLPSPEFGNESTVTDITVLSFSVRNDTRPKLHTLVLRGYRDITNVTLQHLLKVTSLRYLDISGTSITDSAIIRFHLERPEVSIFSNYENTPFEVNFLM